MTDRKYINIQLDEETIRHLDEFAKRINRKRKQVMELLLQQSIDKKITEQDYSL